MRRNRLFWPPGGRVGHIATRTALYNRDGALYNQHWFSQKGTLQPGRPLYNQAIKRTCATHVLQFPKTQWAHVRVTLRCSLKRVGCQVTHLKQEPVTWWIPNGAQQESHWNPMGTRPTGILVAPVEPHWNQTSFLAMGPTGVLLESDRDASY